jgi:hypothetical protein
MAKDTKNAITIDDVEYDVDQMTQRAQIILQHVADLDRKIGAARFNVDQLQVGRDAFFGMLKAELEAKQE